MPCRNFGPTVELVASYTRRLWEAWKDYEKLHGALSGVKLAARVEARIGGVFDDSKLSRIRSGKRRATVEELYALAAELGVSPAWLAFGEGKHPPAEMLPDVPAVDPVVSKRKRG